MEIIANPPHLSGGLSVPLSLKVIEAFQASPENLVEIHPIVGATEGHGGADDRRHAVHLLWLNEWLGQLATGEGIPLAFHDDKEDCVTVEFGYSVYLTIRQHFSTGYHPLSSMFGEGERVYVMADAQGEEVFKVDLADVVTQEAARLPLWFIQNRIHSSNSGAIGGDEEQRTAMRRFPATFRYARLVEGESGWVLRFTLRSDIVVTLDDRHADARVSPLHNWFSLTGSGHYWRPVL